MIQLSPGLTLALNILVWPLWQLSVSYLFLRLPHRAIPTTWRILSPCAAEKSLYFYERVLRIRQWKSRLPDGAIFFRGAFSKKSLAERHQSYLEKFLFETYRGEMAHWVSFFGFPLFALWNPPWAVGVMLAYAVLANLPCIWAQRYNRFKIQRILSKSAT